MRETIIDYVKRHEEEKTMNALDVYTKINIRDYLRRPEEKYDKEYSKERQEIRKYIRKDDLKTKAQGGVIDWSYLLSHVDSEF